MTQTEILAFFPPNGEQFKFGAGEYAVPTLNWLTTTYWDFFKGRLWNDNLGTWATRWECRDFASLYRILAVECWALTRDQSVTSDGLAVGEMWFIPNPAVPGAGHAQNPVITDQGLVIIEPQTGLPCPATLVRLQSRYMLRF